MQAARRPAAELELTLSAGLNVATDQQDWEDEDEQAESDPEDPDESDMDDDIDSPAIDCPYCGESIHEDSEWCHHCGKYLSTEDAPRNVPNWILIGTLLGVAAMIGGIVIWLIVTFVPG
jgi:hypothetical protein